jgi:hypothetical protein
MDIGWHRDSAIWTLSIVAAVLTYLGAAPHPAEWTYTQWIQAASFVVATLAGKLASSPLAGAPKGDGR